MNVFRYLARPGLTGVFAAALMLMAPPAFSSDITHMDGAPTALTPTVAKAEAPVSWRAAPDAGATTVVAFAPLPDTALKAVQEENAPDPNTGFQMAVLKVGVNRNAETEIDAAAVFVLNWQKAASDAAGDGRVARIALTSPDARGMRVALQLRALPDSAEMRFSGSAAPEKILGVVSGEQANALRDGNKVYWTPATDGETQNIEIYLPATVNLEDVNVRLSGVSHLFTSAQDRFRSSLVTKASQSCEVDAVCKYGSLGAKFRDEAKAVAAMLFTRPDGQYVCTGSVVEFGGNDRTIPYMWSAAQCISTQAVANTLNTFWLYEAASCGSAQLNADAMQLTGGAKILHVKTATDTLLLSLNDQIPAEKIPYGVAWVSDPLLGDPMFSIHHPNGDVKKVSTGKGAGRTCDTVFGSDPEVDTSTLSLVSWSEGTIEPGSGGSGAFTYRSSDGSYRLRGGYTGGSASCSTVGASVNNGNASCYSNISQVWDDVKQWLTVGDYTPYPTQDYTGQWIKVDNNGNNDESAWGLTVLMGFSNNYNYIFIPWYTYDSSGKASWYIFQGDSWSANDVFSADVYRYSGPNWGAFPYNNSRVAGAKVGTAKLTFTSATKATFTYNVEGSSRTINLVKLQ